MYDHISFHLDDFPKNLPQQNALHHMGFYYAWAVSQNLHSLEAVQLPQFIENQLNSGLDETCFNELGNRFTQYYYADDDEGYGFFLADYFVALGIENVSNFYHTENTLSNQTKLNHVFQLAFNTWKGSLK